MIGGLFGAQTPQIWERRRPPRGPGSTRSPAMMELGGKSSLKSRNEEAVILAFRQQHVGDQRPPAHKGLRRQIE